MPANLFVSLRCKTPPDGVNTCLRVGGQSKLSAQCKDSRGGLSILLYRSLRFLYAHI